MLGEEFRFRDVLKGKLDALGEQREGRRVLEGDIRRNEGRLDDLRSGRGGLGNREQHGNLRVVAVLEGEAHVVSAGGELVKEVVVIALQRGLTRVRIGGDVGRGMEPGAEAWREMHAEVVTGSTLAAGLLPVLGAHRGEDGRDGIASHEGREHEQGRIEAA